MTRRIAISSIAKVVGGLCFIGQLPITRKILIVDYGLDDTRRFFKSQGWTIVRITEPQNWFEWEFEGKSVCVNNYRRNKLIVEYYAH